MDTQIAKKTRTGELAIFEYKKDALKMKRLMNTTDTVERIQITIKRN